MEEIEPLAAVARLADLAPRPRGEVAAGAAPASFEATTWPLYAPLVRRLVLILGSGSDAEDVAQDAYLRAYQSWQHFDGRDARAWLYTIALRLAFNHIRGRRRWLRLLGSGEPSTWNDSVDPDLLAALRNLDARTRSALLLNAVDGYTQREVAAILGVPEGTVASWISRGRATLRARMERLPPG